MPKKKPDTQPPVMVWNKVKWRKRLLVSTPTEGWVRFEWAHARFGQITPVNWEASGFDITYCRAQMIGGFNPIGYSIDDAYNLITKKALEMGVDWLVLIEDDVLIPANLFLLFANYMNEGEIPVVSGLYYTKSEPAEPLVFRGRGTGPFHGFTLGARVWCDGLPMGCLLIHMSLLKFMWNKSPEYQLCDGTVTHKVFETPKFVFFDVEKGVQRQEGTQDLYFFDRLIELGALKETGWKKVSRKKYPFLCDTSIFCKHIDRNTGRQYPS